MHQSAMKRMEWFIQNYVPKDKPIRVLDVGSYNVNGCYRSLFNRYQCEYIGLDLSPGPNVDVVPVNPYYWDEDELEDRSFDFIISGSAFEHIEYPWLTMKQIQCKLKPNGIACILAPFNLSEHRYPTDCFRYYPDGMIALAKWASLQVIDCTTGGVPEGVDVKQWIPSENYDDTMLIAINSRKDQSEVNWPRLTHQVRSDCIFKAG